MSELARLVNVTAAARSTSPRRGFLVRMLAAAAAAGTSGIAAVPALAQSPRSRDNAQQRSEHDAWMSRVPGRHRQFFHAVGAGETPMLMAKNYLDAYRDSYGFAAGDVGAAIGVHGPALTLAFNDAAWAKYEFGRAHSINDPRTSEPARRNIHREGSDLAIESLQHMGVLFVACNTAFRLRAAAIAQAAGRQPTEVYEEMHGMLLPGVVLVPALVVAISRAQEAGITYVRAS